MNCIIRYCLLMLTACSPVWGTSLCADMRSYILSQKICPVPSLQPWVNVHKTAELIINLLHTDSLHLLLDTQEQQAIDDLITNMSIAEIAFHLEVTACEKPVVAVCYEDGSIAESLLRMISALQSELGLDYTVVAIDLEKLPKLHEVVRDEEAVTILYFMQGHEFGRIEGISDRETVISWLLEITAEQTIRRNL